MAIFSPGVSGERLAEEALVSWADCWRNLWTWGRSVSHAGTCWRPVQGRPRTVEAPEEMAVLRKAWLAGGRGCK